MIANLRNLIPGLRNAAQDSSRLAQHVAAKRSELAALSTATVPQAEVVERARAAVEQMRAAAKPLESGNQLANPREFDPRMFVRDLPPWIHQLALAQPEIAVSYLARRGDEMRASPAGLPAAERAARVAELRAELAQLEGEQLELAEVADQIKNSVAPLTHGEAVRMIKDATGSIDNAAAARLMAADKARREPPAAA